MLSYTKEIIGILNSPNIAYLEAANREI